MKKQNSNKPFTQTDKKIKTMEKIRIEKVEFFGNTWYQVQKRHFIFFWWWVPAWVNSFSGASAPHDTFETLEEAEQFVRLHG